MTTTTKNKVREASISSSEPRALSLAEFLARDFSRRPYGRWETRDGTRYLYDRSYSPFMVKRSGQAPEPCEDHWVGDIVEDTFFGDERERTGRVPADVWNWTKPKRSRRAA